MRCLIVSVLAFTIVGVVSLAATDAVPLPLSLFRGAAVEPQIITASLPAAPLTCSPLTLQFALDAEQEPPASNDPTKPSSGVTYYLNAIYGPLSSSVTIVFGYAYAPLSVAQNIVSGVFDAVLGVVQRFAPRVVLDAITRAYDFVTQRFTVVVNVVKAPSSFRRYFNREIVEIRTVDATDKATMSREELTRFGVQILQQVSETDATLVTNNKKLMCERPAGAQGAATTLAVGCVPTIDRLVAETVVGQLAFGLDLAQQLSHHVAGPLSFVMSKCPRWLVNVVNSAFTSGNAAFAFVWKNVESFLLPRPPGTSSTKASPSQAPDGFPSFVQPSCALDFATTQAPHCVVVSCPSTIGAPGLTVQATRRTVFDTQTLGLLFVAWILWRLRSAVGRSRLLQILLAGAFGVVVMVLGVVYFVATSFQSTRVGKIGLMAIFASSGFAAASQGFLTSMLGWFAEEITRNVFLQIGVVFSAAVSAVLCVKYASAQLSEGLRWSVTGVAMMFFALACVRNEALVVFCSLAHVLVLRHVWRLFRRWLFTDHRFGAARDYFPRSARQLRPYAKPLCSPVDGSSKSERLHAYDELGKINTAKELEALAKYIRENPDVACRLKAPNATMHWAGVGREYGAEVDLDEEEEEEE